MKSRPCSWTAPCLVALAVVVLLGQVLHAAWCNPDASSMLPDRASGDTKPGNALRLRGEVTDAATGRLIPCRIYIQGDDGTWFFPRSESPAGSAIPYRKQRSDNPHCVEMHTTLSAHPFVVDLPPGRYALTVERGKEYLPESRTVTVGKESLDLKLALRRWIDMAERGWYSGDTHVHRTLDELPNVILAEDLNVTFPLLHWVTEAFMSPKTSLKGSLREVDPKVIPVDATHVIYPRNTEYEIFTVGQKRHTLGAFFVLNHQTVFDEGVPPVRPVAQRAHREGGLIELDKHNWPWSMMLVPVMQADLYELANNHLWRTEFGFPGFGEPAADFMQVERDRTGFTERGWLDYGFANYYVLLNCGFRLRPTAGTASGVHPVPLGFGRVYVHCPEGFSYDAWVRGLNQGNSFVTTGPMLFVRVNHQAPGHTFKLAHGEAQEFHVEGSVISSLPLERIEILVNGEVARTVKLANRKTRREGYDSLIDERLKIDSTSWLVVRCYEDRPDKRMRFAHSSPFHIEVVGRPLRPRRHEVEFLIKRVEDQIRRNGDLLPRAAVEEYREALRIYQEIARGAR
jgi:hypothetical protein